MGILINLLVSSEFLRILIVHAPGSSNLPSGEQIVIEQERAYLESKAHVVQILMDRNGFRKNPFTLFWSFKSARWLRQAVHTFQPDIIHFHSVIPYLGLSALIVAKKQGVPVVQTLHNGRWLCVEGGYFRNGKYCNDCVGSFGLKGVIKGCGHGRLSSLLLFFINLVARYHGLLFQWVDRFITVSDFVYLQHLKSGFPEEKMVVNNNGIDIGSLDRAGYAKPWKERSGVAFAGRISVAKGAEVIKQLIPKIKQPFHIIGSGPEQGELQQFCLEKGYDNVVFWGGQSREKTIEILGGVVCTVVPSQCGDSFPTVALESMALGTPVVASNLGGLPGLVGKGGGTIVNPNEYEQFGDSVLKYLNNITIAEADGINCQQYVRDNLSMEVRGRALVQIYEDLLSKQ